ncbi:1-aminocyclopropane-1-carboxylate deaminase, putative [Metarhizium acridum CQMa 102]|uniref:1-aminocyclopropane-1-carboxylate deaminase, putative n=1 Tax=Metarhizium acridum (strain CQMa 102) TaxID=655827 RepID=E9EEJ4_METAQ|nr:1-aminocyclopropane-1-carboxylate deaminase, putative [Metarhizium acridum CQMa 102]EFY85645.1 1-aminocyclopropane-1-carboxylate deaminase, putative [Metarhizium acridum CQMa 102]
MATVTLPEPFAGIPRESFLFGPSPIQHLPRMSKALGGKVNIYVKREDCNSGLAYGGNKTRKLEYLASEALAQGCDTLVSIGGVQSNHTRQVSAAAAKLGLRAATVQEHWVDWQDAGYEKVGNIQLSRLMGADVRLDPSTFGIEHKTTLAKLTADIESSGGKPYYIPAGASDHPLGGLGFARRAFEVEAPERQSSGGRPYYIPAGASDHPLGGLGFARWAFEVEAQERQMGVFFDTVLVCAVTGSTFAGMIAGFKLAQKQGSRPRRLIGIDASGKPGETFDQVLRIAKFTAAKIGLSEDDVTERDVVLNSDYNAGVYGIPDEATIDAIKFGARTEAFITDPVYEGKSLAGMMGLIRSGEISAGNVLYAHLGGQLALNAYSELGL